MTQISKHITLHEATFSATAQRLKISNQPDSETIERMKLVAENCFEPLREWHGQPIKVNSFYRSPQLNKAVGGSRTSQHVFGEAIDMSAGSRTENKKLFEWCKSNLNFDQLIHEYGTKSEGPDWVHISFKSTGNRNQILFVK